MKVLFITDSNAQGGAYVAFVDLVYQVYTKGVAVIVLTGEYNELNRKLKEIGINSVAAGHRMAMGGLASGIRRPISFLKRWILYNVCEIKAQNKISNTIDLSSIDIIHTNSARNSIGCFISKKYGIPHIMHIREFADKDFACVSFRKDYISYYNQFTDKFLAVSNAVRDHWINKGIDKDKILTLYDGVKCDNILLSTDNSKKDDVLKMVIVGGVVRTKGQHIAVKAISLLPEDIRYKVTLDIVGWVDDKYVMEMKDFLQKNNISTQIKFLGARNDVHQILGNYHVGLMCSKSEGFGLVTAEYMHAQLGVIASNSGACPELVVNGECGLLFEVGNAKSLADCIETYFRNRDLLIMHSHEAKGRALSKFTDKINADKIISTYNELLVDKTK